MASPAPTACGRMENHGRKQPAEVGMADRTAIENAVGKLVQNHNREGPADYRGAFSCAQTIYGCAAFREPHTAMRLKVRRTSANRLPFCILARFSGPLLFCAGLFLAL